MINDGPKSTISELDKLFQQQDAFSYSRLNLIFSDSSSFTDTEKSTIKNYLSSIITHRHGRLDIIEKLLAKNLSSEQKHKIHQEHIKSVIDILCCYLFWNMPAIEESPLTRLPFATRTRRLMSSLIDNGHIKLMPANVASGYIHALNAVLSSITLDVREFDSFISWICKLDCEQLKNEARIIIKNYPNVDDSDIYKLKKMANIEEIANLVIEYQFACGVYMDLFDDNNRKIRHFQKSKEYLTKIKSCKEKLLAFKNAFPEYDLGLKEKWFDDMESSIKLLERFDAPENKEAEVIERQTKASSQKTKKRTKKRDKSLSQFVNRTQNRNEQSVETEEASDLPILQSTQTDNPYSYLGLPAKPIAYYSPVYKEPEPTAKKPKEKPKEKPFERKIIEEPIDSRFNPGTYLQRTAGLVPLCKINIDGTAQKVIDALKARNANVVIGGGYVRDKLLSMQLANKGITQEIIPNDIDFYTDATESSLIEAFEDIGYVVVKNPFISNLYHVKNQLIDISIVDKLDPRQLAKKADFKINAFYCVDGEILDPLDMLKELNKNSIETINIPKIVFSDDPIRMLRGVALSLHTQKPLSKATEAAIKYHAHKIQQIPLGALNKHLTAIFVNNDANIGLKKMAQLGLIKGLIPKIGDNPHGFIESTPEFNKHISSLFAALSNRANHEKLTKKQNGIHIIAIFCVIAAFRDNLHLHRSLSNEWLKEQIMYYLPKQFGFDAQIIATQAVTYLRDQKLINMGYNHKPPVLNQYKNNTKVSAPQYDDVCTQLAGMSCNK